MGFRVGMQPGWDRPPTKRSVRTEAAPETLATGYTRTAQGRRSRTGSAVRVLPLMFKSLAAQGRNFSGSLYKNAIRVIRLSLHCRRQCVRCNSPAIRNGSRSLDETLILLRLVATTITARLKNPRGLETCPMTEARVNVRQRPSPKGGRPLCVQLPQPRGRATRHRIWLGIYSLLSPPVMCTQTRVDGVCEGSTGEREKQVERVLRYIDLRTVLRSLSFSMFPR